MIVTDTDMLHFLLTESLLAVNGAKVLRSDVSATNGVIHFIDRILTDILL